MSEFLSVERINSLKSGIEAKTGESYSDLTAGVQALIDGYGQGEESDVIPVVASYMTIDDGYTNMPETLKLHFEVSCNFTFTPSLEAMGKKVKLIGTFADGGSCNIQSFKVSAGSAVQEIDFGGKICNFYPLHTFWGCSSLEVIHASLRLGGTKWDRTFQGDGALKELRFVENHITVTGIPLNACPLLSDESLISAANALVSAGDTALSWSLHATPKARCGEILGTVTQKTADDGTTYDFFAADETGTVTLTEFITVTKGWTLA